MFQVKLLYILGDKLQTREPKCHPMYSQLCSRSTPDHCIMFSGFLCIVFKFLCSNKKDLDNWNKYEIWHHSSMTVLLVHVMWSIIVADVAYATDALYYVFKCFCSFSWCTIHVTNKMSAKYTNIPVLVVMCTSIVTVNLVMCHLLKS